MEQTTISGIYRDESGALINRNNEALLSYKRQKQVAKSSTAMQQQIQLQQEVINNLKNDISEMKQLLFSIVNRDSSKGQ